MSFLGTCEESTVKWRGYRDAFLTLLDEKLLSKVAADYLRLIKKLRKHVFLNTHCLTTVFEPAQLPQETICPSVAFAKGQIGDSRGQSIIYYNITEHQYCLCAIQ